MCKLSTVALPESTQSDRRCARAKYFSMASLVAGVLVFNTAPAFACGGVFDVACNVTHGGLDPHNIQVQTQKAAQDAANAAAKAAQDTANAAAKATQDVANAINELQASVLSGPALEQAIIASHNTAINGATPIPPEIRQQLTGYASDDSMNRVRFKIGDNGFVNVARLLEQGGFASAVTLIDVIVFRGPSEANDLSIWAHELTHVDQYRDWGTHSFAVQYTRNWHSVEDPAYAKGDGFADWAQSRVATTPPASSQVSNGASGGLPCHGLGVSMVPAGWQGCMPGSNNVQFCSGAPFPGDPRFGQWVTLNQLCQ
jgi:hypothetical protein